MQYKLLITLMLISSWIMTVSAQIASGSCDCPKTLFTDTKADTAFRLSNGKTIVLCGYKYPGRQPAAYTEFVLAVCGQDTIIDFWSPLLTYQFKTDKDTLLAEQLHILPTGKDFNYQETLWITEKIYFRGQIIIWEQAVNRNIPRYNKAQIATVLKEYRATKPNLTIFKEYVTTKPGLKESDMVLADKLFIATLCGDKTARRYFNEFPGKFQHLDGHFAEQYNELTAMLTLWDSEF